MSCVQLTKSAHLRPIAIFLSKQGERIEPLLENSGLPVTCLDDSKTLVPTASLWRFRELAAARTGLPNLTLEVMNAWELSELGDLGRALQDAPTLRGMIRKFERLVRAESSTTVIGLRPWSGDREFFYNRFLLKQDQGEWQAELYLLIWMLKIVRVVDPTWLPTEIWCKAGATRQSLLAIESIGARPRFNQSCIGFSIPRRLLAMTPRVGLPSPQDPIPDDRILLSSAPSPSTPEATRQLIRAYADDTWLTIEEASDALGTSPRTLQRHLSAEGSKYSELIEDVRAERANRLLDQTDASLSEIARQVGYSTLSNFNRAFRRWAAVSPREFRRQRQGTVTSGP